MAEKFLISGGIPRVLGELMAGHVFKKAELAEVDFAKKTYSPVLTYKTPTEFCANNLPSITFGCFNISGGKIYLPTRTEVLVIDEISYEIIEVITDPLFNDIHDVLVFKEKLYVVVTGLDAVFIYDLNSREREIINVLGKEPFHKYNESDNLNKIASLKPNKAHPNHLVEINGEIWVTRLHLKDAVCLFDIERKIDIKIGPPHDGFVVEDLVYFTTVNGYVVVYNRKIEKIIRKIKLTSSAGNNGIPLGWCRGLYVDEKYFYVGFTKLRTTKITVNLDWAKAMLDTKKFINTPLPTRIEKYKLDGTYVSHYTLPKDGICNIFSIVKKD